MSFVEPILEIMAAAREARQVELLDLTGKRAPLIDAPPRSPSQDIEDRDFEQEPETYRDKDAVFERGVDRQTMHLCPGRARGKKALRLEDEVKTMKEAPASPNLGPVRRPAVSRSVHGVAYEIEGCGGVRGLCGPSLGIGCL